MRSHVLSSTIAIICSGSACDNDYRSDRPMAPCTVDDVTDAGQALQVIRSEIEILAGNLRCRPGRSDECEQLLREKCVVDLGDVPVGETLRFPVAIRNPAYADLAIFRVDTESEDCVDTYLDGPPPWSVSATSEVVVEAIVRPSAVGPCLFSFIVESNGGNVNETTTVAVEATRIAGPGPEGCTTDGVCCCGEEITATPPSCDERGRLSCGAGNLQFGDESCSDASCVR
jgi:hypothetical protein